jgi:hypothetical protein
MSPADVAGVVGAGLMLAGYGAIQARKLNPHGAPALTLNLVGAGLVMASLLEKFNLAAFVMEAAWALIALAGLLKLGWTRWRGDR